MKNIEKWPETKAALKPILNCTVHDAMFAVCDDGQMKYLTELVFAAQRIYNGAEKAR